MCGSRGVWWLRSVHSKAPSVRSKGLAGVEVYYPTGNPIFYLREAVK